MVARELIHEDDKPVIARALLLRHRHVNENTHGGIFYGSRRRLSSFTSILVSLIISNFFRHCAIQCELQNFELITISIFLHQRLECEE